MRASDLRAMRSCVLAACAALGVAQAASAQTVISHTEDAAPIPKGMLRTRITTSWTRFDERFTANGRQSLSDELSTDSLGPRQLPLLAPVESGLQTLTGNPNTRLTLGRLDTKSDARIVVTPIALEYGVTNRLSIGVTVPVVQTRRAIHPTVNADTVGRAANVGFVARSLRGTAATQNASVASGFQRAADSLATLISKCPASPNAAGCAAVLANPTAAATARQNAQGFANAVRTTLGVDSASVYLAPRAGSTIAAATDSRRVAINAQLQQFLGANAGSASNVFLAPTPFSFTDFQGRNGVPGLLQSPLGAGLDSLRTVEQLSVGDVSVGAQLLVHDGFSHDSLRVPEVQTRFAVGGSVRFATSVVDSSRSTLVIPAGDGAGFEAHGAFDFITGRLGGTLVGRYVKSFARDVVLPVLGDPEAAFPVPQFGTVSRTAGTVMGVDFTPRLLLGEWFAFDGHYGFERTGATTYVVGASSTPCAACASLPNTVTAFTPNDNARTAQRLGFGARYSTVDAYLRGHARYPVEVSFTHLETITGDAGVAKLARDQVQLRLYLQVLGRH